ncbi:BTAD domain-containing putative transcriptional regulator [Streptomonospora algeriensis]|uniref:BTAD domain-containing putative transcriptional regulator n=1 Tax=Streptomonospora algeriensis TaxID=995084 RepID=A0ABW3BAC0_9ACTN
MPATPSAPKLRSVLALLVLRTNTIVGTHQIIEELWGEQPPPSATTTLQTYIYQLRKLLCLGDSVTKDADYPEGPVLRTSYGGYRLDLPPGSLDSQRFTSTVSQGRAMLAEGELEAAAETLRSSLSLWRGAALADVARGPQTEADVVRLNEIYNSALESRIDADLQLGRPNEVISELTGLVAQQPTHEGFQAKLMQALYSVGRRSEALGVFQRARTALTEQLGLEPSDELQQLQRRILAGDVPSAPTREGDRTVRASPPLPDSLPPAETDLLGRDRETSALLGALHRGGPAGIPVIAVSGAPGVGKTSFALRTAHSVRGDYRDGLFYVRLPASASGHAALGHALGQLLTTAGFPPARIPDGTGQRAAMFREWSARRRILVVLDDMPDTDGLSLAVPAGAKSALIVVSRRRMADIAVTDAIDLSCLGEETCLRLLSRFDTGRRLCHDPESSAELVRLCGGLPKALLAAVNCYRRRPHWNADRLMSKIRNGSEDILCMREAVSASLFQMGAEAAAAVQELARNVPRCFDVGDAASILGRSEDDTEALLEHLVEFHLLAVEPEGGESTGEGGFRYSLSPVVRWATRPAPSAVAGSR